MNPLVEFALTGRAPSGAAADSARWAGLGDVLVTCDDPATPGAITFGQTYRPDTMGIGRTIAKADDTGIMTVASSGQGKSLTLLVENGAKWGGGLFSLDPAGDLILTTAETRSRRQPILALDPMGVAADWGVSLPATGVSYNPLDAISEASDQACDDIWVLVEMLIEDEPRDNFWPPITREFLAGLYAMFVLKRMGTVPDVFSLIDRPPDEVINLVGHTMCMMIYEHPLADMVRAAGNLFVSQEDKGRGYIVDTIKKCMKVFKTPSMRRVMQSGPLRFADMKSSPFSCYIVIPMEMMKSHGAWLGMMVHTFLVEVGRDVTVPDQEVLAIFDEFQNLPYLERCDGLMSYARAKGIKPWLVLQGIDQIKETYPESWRSFFNNAGATVLLGIEEPETVDYFRDWIGQTSEYQGWFGWRFVKYVWRQSFKMTAPERRIVPLLSSDGIRLFNSRRRGGVLVKFEGTRWMRGKRRRYDDVLTPGVDYMVHPRFAIGQSKHKLLEAA